MRLKTIISMAFLMVAIGVTTAACGNTNPDQNPYEFLDSR